MLLEVNGLTKYYREFKLDNVAFSLDEGYIMGFIGRNGAGKSTTIKSMLNLVHRDGGSVYFEGKDFFQNETESKAHIGVVLGEFNCYNQSKLKDITAVTKRFYPEWDDNVYKSYLEKFSLDESKKVKELSAGMKVKYALTLALSHNAKLLILDEPTSGLDPVSRDDLLDVFRSIIEDGTRSILFSTHIISDLEKCADYITYIKNGKVYISQDVESFKDGFRLVSGEAEDLIKLKDHLIGYKEHAFGFTGLVKKEDLDFFEGLKQAPADLESIMIYVEQEEKHE